MGNCEFCISTGLSHEDSCPTVRLAQVRSMAASQSLRTIWTFVKEAVIDAKTKPYKYCWGTPVFQRSLQVTEETIKASHPDYKTWAEFEQTHRNGSPGGGLAWAWESEALRFNQGSSGVLFTYDTDPHSPSSSPIFTTRDGRKVHIGDPAEIQHDAQRALGRKLLGDEEI